MFIFSLFVKWILLIILYWEISAIYDWFLKYERPSAITSMQINNGKFLFKMSIELS